MAEQESGLGSSKIGERSVKFLNEDKGKTLYPPPFPLLVQQAWILVCPPGKISEEFYLINKTSPKENI